MFKITSLLLSGLVILPFLTWEVSLLMLIASILFLLIIPRVARARLACMGGLSVSNLRFLLIGLTLITLFWAVSYAPKVEKGQSIYLILFLLIILLIVLVLFFRLSNTLIIYITFELSVLPIFLIILGWGYQRERLRARFRLLFYTLTASIPLLVAILWLRSSISQYEIISFGWFRNCKISTNWILRYSIFLAFAVKLPIFGVHMWLPKAHVEAPVIGSMILAAILLKLGRYGLYIFLPVYSFSSFNRMWVSVCFLGVLPVSCLCLRLTDLKIIIAYSSVGHIGLIAASILLVSKIRNSGAILVILAHGIRSSAIFMIAFILYQANHSRSLLLTKGILTWRRIIPLFWFLILLANIASPPTLNLLAEILVITRVVLESDFNILIMICVILVRTGYSLIIYSSRVQGRGVARASNAPLYIRDLVILFNQLVWVFIPVVGLNLIFLN